MKKPNAPPRPADDLATTLELAVQGLHAIDGAPDRMVEFREAIRLVEALVARVDAAKPAELPAGFADLLLKARHCLKMGKPRECLFQFRRLRQDLNAFRRAPR